MTEKKTEREVIEHMASLHDWNFIYDGIATSRWAKGSTELRLRWLGPKFITLSYTYVYRGDGTRVVLKSNGTIEQLISHGN